MYPGIKVLLPAALLLATSVTRADWIEQSNAYAMEVLITSGELEPEAMAGYGLSEFDSAVIDLGPDFVARRRAVNDQQLKRLGKQLSVQQQPKVREDLQILVKALEQENLTAQIEHDHLLPYFNLHGLLFNSFNSLLDPRNEPERYPAALARLSKYTGQSKGFEPLTELAKARTEERFGVTGLVGPYREELQTDLESAPHYIEGIRELFETAGLTGWQQDFKVLEQQLAEYKSWLQQTLLPKARPDNRLPEAVYANNLKTYGVDASPAELIAQGQYSYQLIRSEMKALAWRIAEQRGWKDKSLGAVMRALKKEQIPQDELLEVYQQRLAEIEDIIRREHLVTLPERDAVIRMATEAESAAIPASFMSPPQLINNTGQYGEFVLVQKNPTLKDDAVMDDWSHDAIIWALTVHEARPGHELQFSSLVENGTSLARAIFAFNSANAEGWGLYAESIMQEFLPLEGQLFNLFTREMRAARMFLDPMVNTGQLSRDAAETFLVEQLTVSRAMASSEADRYAFRAPGQATSYYYGYTNLMRLRTEVEIALGSTFDQLEFHDFIIEQGILPPELLRKAVLARFTAK